jgi:hypothetical protein
LNQQIVKATLKPAGDQVVQEKRWHKKLPNLFAQKGLSVCHILQEFLSVTDLNLETYWYQLY